MRKSVVDCAVSQELLAGRCNSWGATTPNYAIIIHHRDKLVTRRDLSDELACVTSSILPFTVLHRRSSRTISLTVFIRCAKRKYAARGGKKKIQTLLDSYELLALLLALLNSRIKYALVYFRFQILKIYFLG